ncbi:MAG TPA: Ltp family lipoprotein [Solirubrobacteraceae bacterium]|jgi:hypothetical protein|nr:Ltp family lipoprotein [Solirubrobacteraceae bacterium]
MGITRGRALGTAAGAVIGICAAFTATVGGATAALPRTTTAQRNAIEAAEQYISEQPFSKAGLIQQLASSAGDGYGRAVAAYAVNHIKVKWNTEAVLDAKQYLSEQPFSKAGLF